MNFDINLLCISANSSVACIDILLNIYLYKSVAFFVLVPMYDSSLSASRPRCSNISSSLSNNSLYLLRNAVCSTKLLPCFLVSILQLFTKSDNFYPYLDIV
nr:MAG TPA: hypothetical protein [Caudoviricetes sp.]